MSSSVSVIGYLKTRRDRALGSILGYAERRVYPKLTADERAEFRAKVIEALQNYHDAVLDLHKGDDGSELRNERILELLESVHGTLEKLTVGG